MNLARFHLVLATLFAFGYTLGNQADLKGADGEPIAVQVWPDGNVSIQNHWGLSLLIDPSGESEQQPAIDPDQTLDPTESFHHVLDRQANAEESTWQPIDTSITVSDNSIAVTSIKTNNDHCGLLMIVDGVRLAYLDGRWPTDLAKIANLDLLIDAESDAEQIVASADLIRNQIRPKQLLLCRVSANQTATIEKLRSCFGRALVVNPDRNALPVSTQSSDRGMPVVVLGDAPWQMPEELSALFLAMEKSNRNSQAVFAKLSANQMNFQPANGTHTPRWNTEHMMGRQLLFFSQIYHELDPAIPVIDLNPEQMPPDYVFRHPDWDGREEARQMQRASDFARRFAYLLDGIDLDSKAPGSRWTLRGLLNQMERHYGEHTANTTKKFNLPDWPKE